MTNDILKARLMPGPLAQSVEQRTFNPWVVGSIPTGPTKGVLFWQIYATFKKCMGGGDGKKSHNQISRFS